MKKFITYISLSALAYANTYDSIEFKNLTQISQEMALETLGVKKNQNISEALINDALKKFYSYNYFDDISVEVIENKLIFNFKEKPFIAKLDMSGYKTRDDELDLLFSTMGLKKGTMYTPRKIEKAKQILLSNLEKEGYINSVIEVDTENINEQSMAVKFNVNKGDQITITKIDYIGAKNLDVGDFEDVIANKETDCCFTWFFGRNDGEMSLEQLDYDSLRIKDLYMQNGYLDAKVSKGFSKIDFNNNTAQIQYVIVEGKQYKVNDTLIYVDETVANAEEIKQNLKLEKEDIFNINHLRKDQEYIKTQIADKGYAFAQVDFDLRKNEENSSVDIIYNVIPGDKVYINDVIISGNSRTLDRVVRRSVYLAPSDLFSLTDYKDSINALRRTGYFENVTIEQKRISSDKMDLLVKVTEAPTGNLVLGGGYGSYDGWMLNASISDKNIFGSGLNLGFSIDYSSKRNNYTVNLTNPMLNDGIYSGTVSLYRNETTITSTDTVYGDKDTFETGFGVGIGRGIGRHTRVGTNYAYDDIQVKYSIGTIYDNQYVTSSITPYINFNNTDDYFIPRSGMMAGTSLKYAGVGGDAKYMLSSTYFKYFYSLENLTDYDIIFRYKNSLKLLEDSGKIPDGTTFYLGGPTSLRGYNSYAFQPDDSAHPYTRYFTNTLELSFPLIPSAKMRWALFYDYGMIGETSFSQIQRAGQGALIAWYSPVGPLQFIFSQAVNPEPGDETTSFEFSLGTKF
ncbi:MAG: outer membrane protein assembly factor BamA [Campylobacterales bacterium]|nr:outer membrane protein assembly factor BamA [Campylobacterales bacterium]